ncbi:MAG: DUF5615 family PIN-like protein, partial [Anaerolineae bacterium]|nr:DUF5615 family PIN-like protein [Anaerolineae bacterium]
MHLPAWATARVRPYILRRYNISPILPVHASDQEILELARRQNRAVVTQDLDFSALLALGGYDRPSLVILRLSVSDPEAVTDRLLNVLPRLEQVLQEGCAVTMEETAVRIRRLP